LSAPAELTIKKIKSNRWIITTVCLLAAAGCTERQLTRPTPQMDAEKRFWIRVLLSDKLTSCELRFPSSFVIKEPEYGLTLQRCEKSRLPMKARILDGKFTIQGRVIEQSELIIAPDEPYIFSIDRQRYRGNLKLSINDGGRTFKAVNLVPLEPYLAGVVGAEMPDYWEPATLQSQAIAARTYCLYIKRKFGPHRSWDVTKTAASQVYDGIAAESAQIWDAVNKTWGCVLVCRQDDGGEDIFPAYYSSVCGGHTENSKNVFGDSFEPLCGVPCPYCQKTARPSFFYWPMVQFDKNTVNSRLTTRYPKLKPLDTINEIIAVKKSDYDRFSRLTLVKLVGTNGKTGFLRAEDLRLAIDPTGEKLRSTICRIAKLAGKWAFVNGRGFGHGVGMCQCGAQAMAREGRSAEKILSYYYPGSKIKRLY